jgi:hypothetical protein
MKEETTQELMNQLSDRLILDLAKGETVCPTCKGLRFVLVQRGKNTYIESCRDCYNGKNYVCEYCGTTNKTDHCDCEGAKNERILEEQNKEVIRFNNAEKINYKDYDGYFIWSDRAIDKDGLEEELYEAIYNGEEPPKYIYATTKDLINVGIDIYDEISNNCSEGYEDMEDNLDMNSDKLKQAQTLIDEWVVEQGTSLDCYTEDYSKVVMLDEIIEEIRREINQELINKI